MRTRRALATVVGLVVVVALAAGLELVGEEANAAPATSSFFDVITRFDSDVTIDHSGSILVRETIVYDFGPTRHHGIYRDIPVRVDWVPKPHYDRVFPLQVLSVRGSPGTPVQYTVEDEGDNERIKIGDPDRTITGVHTYEITY